jgi:hypothetical protein
MSRQVALLLAAFGLAGCNLIPLVPSAKDRPDTPSTPGLPSKHSFRVSQYVFLADFEVKRNLPIFRERPTT